MAVARPNHQPLYTPLRQSAREFRILQLYPPEPLGDDSAEICCELEVFSLLPDSDCTRYKALSYVWGDANDRRPIVVNGHVLMVTVNLVAALRRLRSGRQKPRKLWVDAVCINQDDPAEKQMQIPLMGNIYASATTVLAWLGEDPTPSMAAAFDMSNKEESHSVISMSLVATRAVVFRKREDPEARFFQLYNGFVEILSRPYWSRMWTFQEFWLADLSPVLVCGPYQCPANEIMLRALHLEILYVGLRDGLPSFKHGYSGQFNPLTQRFVELGLPWKLDADVFEIPPSSGIKLLAMSGHRGCHDQRDRIFGLYSLMPALAKDHPADYSKPIEQVVQETTTWLILQALYEALQNFSFQGELAEEEGSVLGPSWQPDIMASSHQRLRVSDTKHYAPFPGISPYLRIEEAQMVLHRDEGTIVVPGRIIGRCEVIHQLSKDARKAITEVSNLIRMHKEPDSSTRWAK